MDSDRIRKQIAKQNPSEPVTTYVRDLRHGMKKVNVDALVLDTPQPKQVHTQFGNAVMMANVYIEDETGKIKLCLWDSQVNTIEAGDSIQIRNASVATFKGEKQLRLGKNGTLTVVGKQPLIAKGN
jgi:replication factor A1